MLDAARQETHALRLETARRLRQERAPATVRVRALREEWNRRRGRGVIPTVEWSGEGRT